MIARGFVGLLLLGLAAPLSGCAKQAPSRIAWPWSKKADDVVIAGPTPQERIEELKAISERAEEMPAAEQETVSLRLAEQLAAEQDSIIRCQILRTLGTLRTPTADAMLKAGLEDSDLDVKTTVCAILGQRGDAASVSVLGDTLAQDSNLDVRLAAARALGQIKNEAAVQPLGVALDDPDPAMQRRAVESLRQVTGRDFGNDVVAWRTYVQGGEPARRRATLADLWRRWL